MKNINIFKKHISILSLGVIALMGGAQASNPIDNIFGDPISKKRAAEDCPKQEERSNKKPRRDSDNIGLLKEEHLSSTDSFFHLMPPETLHHITPYLSTEDKKNFALVSKELYDPARNALMSADIRELKDKEWTNGPKKNTFENYLLNNIVWKMSHALAQSKLRKGKILIPDMTLLIKGYSYLEKRFSNMESLEGILQGISNPREFSKSNSGIKMLERALTNPMSGEFDFAALIYYITTHGQEYYLPMEESSPMGLLERFHRVREARREIKNRNENSSEEDIDYVREVLLSETVLTYELTPSTIQDLSRAAAAHYDAGLRLDTEQKLFFFTRAAKLYEMILEKKGTSVTTNDIINTIDAYAHSAKNTTDPDRTKYLERKAVLEDWQELLENNTLPN